MLSATVFNPRDVFLVGTAGVIGGEKSGSSNPGRPPAAGEGPFPAGVVSDSRRRTTAKALEEVITPAFRDRIILAGWIDDKRRFLRRYRPVRADLRPRRFPNVLLEAGKYNLPVISTLPEVS